MVDRRPYVIATVIAVASLAVGGIALIQANRMRQAATPTASGEDDWDLVLNPSAALKLPAGTKLLSPDENGEIRGMVVCGRCIWGIGDSCNVMIWDQQEQHVTVVLPNEKLAKLKQQLDGSG